MIWISLICLHSILPMLIFVAGIIHNNDFWGFAKLIVLSAAQLVESTSFLELAEKSLNLQWLVWNLCDLPGENTMGPYGWMRFHREALSVCKPLSHDRELDCHPEWTPLCRCCGLLLACQSASDGDVQESDLAPHGLRLFITHFSISVPSVHPSHLLSPAFQMFASSLSESACLRPPLLWSPQKRLIQEGWVGVSELSLLCPMRRFHSTFLLLHCFYSPDMLTVQVVHSGVIQLYQLHKDHLFSSLKALKVPSKHIIYIWKLSSMLQMPFYFCALLFIQNPFIFYWQLIYSAEFCAHFVRLLLVRHKCLL